MKKPLFVITEVLLSTLFVAAAAATAAVAVDMKTDMFHIDKWDPLQLGQVFSVKDNNKKTEPSKTESSQKEASQQKDSSEKETSQKEGSEKTASSEEKTESSDISVPDETESSDVSVPPEDVHLLRTAPSDLAEQPAELTELMEAYEYSYDGTLSGNKLLLVEADSESTSKAKLYCYAKEEDSGLWWNAAGSGIALCDEVYIGENGSGYEVTPDSQKTPAGIWTAGDGFYINEKPDTDYPLFQITEDTYWVTDEKSKFFNRKVEGIEEKDWSTADHMISSEKSYQYGLVVNYNTEEPEAGKGCGIFMHCGSTPTEGCIALPEDTMKMILEWLDEDSSPMIWITL